MTERKGTIVIVDDQPDDQFIEVLIGLLTGAGYQTRVLSDHLYVQSILEQIENIEPILVLTDYMWGDGNPSGFSLYQKLDLPTVLMSYNNNVIDDYYAQGKFSSTKRLFDKGDMPWALLPIVEELLASATL